VRHNTKALAIVITHLGGGRDWWKVEARGTYWIVCGQTNLTDVMFRVNRSNCP